MHVTECTRAELTDVVDCARTELGIDRLSAEQFHVLYDERPEVKDVVSREVLARFDNHRPGAEQRALDGQAQTAGPGANDQHL